jgi:hypothetical protein
MLTLMGSTRHSSLLLSRTATPCTAMHSRRQFQQPTTLTSSKKGGIGYAIWVPLFLGLEGVSIVCFLAAVANLLFPSHVIMCRNLYFWLPNSLA